MQDMNQDHVDQTSHAVNANTQEDNAHSPSFSVFRFRQMSEQSQDFYDPVTDILNILPEAIQNAMATIEPFITQAGLIDQGVIMADNIHQLFQIRLIEQKDPIDDVLRDFMTYYKDIDHRIRSVFTEALFIQLMVLWGVSQRRSSQNQPKKIIDPQDTMSIGTINAYLSDTTARTVRRELVRAFSDSIKMLDSEASNEPIGFTDESLNVVLADAKSFVSKIIPIKDGPKSWDSIAKAADRIPVNSSIDAAIKDTYPQYKRYYGKLEDIRRQ